jgi:hypothetical protein
MMAHRLPQAAGLSNSIGEWVRCWDRVRERCNAHRDRNPGCRGQLSIAAGVAEELYPQLPSVFAAVLPRCRGAVTRTGGITMSDLSRATLGGLTFVGFAIVAFAAALMVLS